MNLLDIAIAAERIREYEAGYRSGHRIGYEDAKKCDPSRLLYHAEGLTPTYREGYDAGYCKGWESAR